MPLSLGAVYRRLLAGLGLLLVIALALRAWLAPGIPGSYDPELDLLLYAGGRLLHGEWAFADLVNGHQPLLQLLYTPSAGLGEVRFHRLLILLVDLAAALLLALALLRFARLGLIRLGVRPALPWVGAMVFLIFSQVGPDGLSGLPEHFANLGVALAMALIGGAAADGASAGQLRRRFAMVGVALALALNTCPRLSGSLLIVLALVPVLVRQRGNVLRALLPLLAGGALATGLVYLPLLLRPGGGALVMAGAVALPLEAVGPPQASIDPLSRLLSDTLAINLAGLPLGLLVLVPTLGLLLLALRLWRTPPGTAERVLWLPLLAAAYGLGLLESFQRAPSASHDLLLLAPSLAIVVTCGLAALEGYGARRWGTVARGSLLILALLLTNNIAIAPARNHWRGKPAEKALELEADRKRVRDYLSALPRRDRGFTAPQDVALQRQLDSRASTRGIGPRWSLNQRRLVPSWATRTLALPTSVGEVCEQLTAPANHHLVWMRTDPDGPNTEAFLRGCLSRDQRSWRDLSDSLGLRSGEYRLFRREDS